MTRPPSISGAARLTSITCEAEETALLGPPAKKLRPPPSRVPSSTVGNAGAPYWTAVNDASTVQPGKGTTVSLSVAPAPASAPGFWTRLPKGMSAKAAAGNSNTATSAASSERIARPSQTGALISTRALQ